MPGDEAGGADTGRVLAWAGAASPGPDAGSAPGGGAAAPGGAVAAVPDRAGAGARTADAEVGAADAGIPSDADGTAAVPDAAVVDAAGDG